MNAASLRGYRVLVTGASGGIGAAVAEQLARAGAIVAAHYRDGRDSVDALSHRAAANGGRVIPFRADLLDPTTWGRLVEDVASALGGLDALVNNAGRVMQPMPVMDMTLDAWDDNFTLNATAPFFLAREAFVHMRRESGGRIVNVSSIGVKFGGSATSVAYAAAKSALETMTVALARAGAPFNILVNAVRPGVIDTPAWNATTEGDLRQRVDLIPMKRRGTPGEVASLVGFLLTPEASYITGQVIGVTGGE